MTSRHLHCPHCGADAAVRSELSLATRLIVRLDCGHYIVTLVSDSGDSSMGKPHMTARNAVCIACDTPFVTYMEGPYYEFCIACREGMGIVTYSQAEDLIAGLNLVPVSDRAAIVADLKERRRAALPVLPAGRVLQISTPPPNPAAVLAGIRAQIDYSRLADDAAPDVAAPISYIIAKNGLFEVRDNDIARIITQPKEVLGVATEMQAGIERKLPPVPFEMLRTTIAFFREVVAKRSGAEAIVRVWWDRETSTYSIRIPEGTQRVTGGGVHHDDNFDVDVSGRYLLVMDIHSHNTMSAFWSGIDDADERKAPEGRMLGVIGKLTSLMPEWKWRMRTREGFVELTVADVFDVPTEAPVPFTVSWRILMAVLGTADERGHVGLKVPIDPFRDATFPIEWMERVSNNWHSGHGSYSGHSGHAGFSGATLYGPAKQFIYILDTASGKLQEHLIDGAVVSLTGKELDLGSSYIIH